MDTVAFGGAVGAPTSRAKSLNLPWAGIAALRARGRVGREALSAGPGLNFLCRFCERRGRFQPLPQARQLAENRQAGVKLIGMEIIHRVDRQFDNTSIRTEGQAQSLHRTV